MLHHIEIYVSRLDVSKPFWRSLLRRVSYRQTGAWPGGFTLSNGRHAYLTFVQVAETHAGRPCHRLRGA